jgi:hypothetical protein
MVGILNADPAGAAGGCFSNGDLHGIGGYDKAEAAVAVDDGGGGGLMEDTDGWVRVGSAGLLEADIPDEACDAVRINSAEIRAQQRRSGGAGVLLRTADPAKNFDRKIQ